MNKVRKELYLDKDFELTMRTKYPFIRSLSHACNLLNAELKQNMGLTNGQIFKIKKR
jgi:hypothetical protein